MKGKISHALIVAIVSALLGSILIYSANPKSTGAGLFYVALYWFICGFVFHLIDSGSRKIIRTILYVVFLNLPWYIEESVRQHNAGLIVRMMVESMVMGLIIGLVSMNFQKKIAKTQS